MLVSLRTPLAHAVECSGSWSLQPVLFKSHVVHHPGQMANVVHPGNRPFRRTSRPRSARNPPRPVGAAQCSTERATPVVYLVAMPLVTSSFLLLVVMASNLLAMASNLEAFVTIVASSYI